MLLNFTLIIWDVWMSVRNIKYILIIKLNIWIRIKWQDGPINHN
jgi:hypothetical protein